MNNQFDVGIQEDFDNMTYELGRECYVYERVNDLTYSGQEGTDSELKNPIVEIVFLQELDSEHEMITSGQMNIGDVKFTFKSDSIIKEEYYVSPDLGSTKYKILKLTKVKNQTNDSVLFIKGFGKKVPNR